MQQCLFDYFLAAETLLLLMCSAPSLRMAAPRALPREIQGARGSTSSLSLTSSAPHRDGASRYLVDLEGLQQACKIAEGRVATAALRTGIKSGFELRNKDISCSLVPTSHLTAAAHVKSVDQRLILCMLHVCHVRMHAILLMPIA